jgi:hypothetical protein
MPNGGPLNCNSRKNRKKLLANIVSVENFHASNLTGNNVKDEHPFFRHQAHISMAGAVGTFGFRVKRAADGVSASATVENGQTEHLGGQLGFALLFEKLPKLGGELGKRVSEKQWFFGLLVHGNTA